MKLSKQLTDKAILEELGKRVAAQRVAVNLTQAELSEKAGLSKRTLERLEAGESTQLSNFIRILISLEFIDRLEVLFPEPLPAPMELLKNKGKERKRAKSQKGRQKKDPWTWGDKA